MTFWHPWAWHHLALQAPPNLKGLASLKSFSGFSGGSFTTSATPKIMRAKMSGEATDSFVVETKNGQVEWNLDSECRRIVIRIAREFGMSAEQFLELYSRHRLPAQLVPRDRLSEEKAPAGFAVRLCDDRLIQKRIRRAARFAGFNVKDFVWRALAGCVNCCEDDMILNPKNGQPVANDVQLESFIVKHELEV
jgi:hypothetical protein